MKSKSLNSIFIRYLILFIIAIFSGFIFSTLFTTPTIFLSYTLLSIFYSATLVNQTILINNISLTFIEACIAPSAYLLLTILHLATPWKSSRRLILSLLMSYLLFLIFNIIRIVFLAHLFINDSAYFDLAHKLLWYGASTLLVIGIWFFNVFLFKIKSIPIYTDVKSLFSRIN